MSDQREQDRTYEELVRDAGDAMTAEGDLSPEQWVRVRQGVDATGPASGFGFGLRWVVAMAAVVALGFWWSSGDVVPVLDESQVAQAPSQEAAEPRAERVDKPVVGQALQGVAAGDRLQATSEDRSWTAFDRHELVLSSGGELLVKRWEPRVTHVWLSRGVVTAEVDKLHGEERFQIETGDVTVRVVGTRFTVALLSDGGTQVSVEEGVVEVTDQAGRTDRVLAGQRRSYGIPDAPAEQVKEPAVMKRRATPRVESDTPLKVIEIEVPPQSAPVPEQMRQDGTVP